MVKLIDWKFYMFKNEWCVKGNFGGFPPFKSHDSIISKKIVGLSVKNNGLLVHTEFGSYACAYSRHVFDDADLLKILPSVKHIHGITAGFEKIRECSDIRKKNAIKKVKTASTFEDKSIILYFDRYKELKADYYIIKNDDKYEMGLFKIKDTPSKLHVVSSEYLYPHKNHFLNGINHLFYFCDLDEIGSASLLSDDISISYNIQALSSRVKFTKKRYPLGTMPEIDFSRSGKICFDNFVVPKDYAVYIVNSGACEIKLKLANRELILQEKELICVRGV